jgi:hypothetical protein
MDPISLEDLALLEVLKRISQHTALTDEDSVVRDRMIERAWWSSARMDWR